MTQLDALIEAERQTRLAVEAVSILRQIGERVEIPSVRLLIEELIALARAQRRVLRSTHRQMEGDPLMAHLLHSRAAYRRAEDRGKKSNKRSEELILSSFRGAQAVGFHGALEDWRALLAIFPRP